MGNSLNNINIGMIFKNVGLNDEQKNYHETIKTTLSQPPEG